MKASKFIFLLFIIISCKSIDDVMIKSISDVAKNKITSIDILFLKYTASKDINLLKDAENSIGELEKDFNKNKYFEARVFALYCQLYLLKNDKSRIYKYISEIEKRNPYEERLFLIKADIEKDIGKKETIIKTGIEKANENNLLKLYLADLYFLKGKFTESTAMFDDATINLSEEYKKFYKKRRDLAYYFIKWPPQNIKSVSYLLEDEISVDNLIQITINEFKDSKRILDVKFDTVKDIYEKLKADDYFSAQNVLKLDDKIKRKDIAYFILHIVAKLDKNQNLVNKYNKLPNTSNTVSENELSPVPDVKFSDYFYTAVLVLVEREIMDLPDGTNFFPEKTTGGIEYLGILKKLMKFY